MATRPRANQERRDPETEDIIRTYLPGGKNTYASSVKWFSLKKVAHRIAYPSLVVGILAIVFFFLLSSKKLQVSVTLLTPEKAKSSKLAMPSEYPIDRSIATIYFAGGASKISGVKANEIILALEPKSKRAEVVYNFNHPVDLSHGQITFGACSLEDTAKIKLILKDINL